MSKKNESIIMEINKEAWELLVQQLKDLRQDIKDLRAETKELREEIANSQNKCDSCRNSIAIEKLSTRISDLEKIKTTGIGIFLASKTLWIILASILGLFAFIIKYKLINFLHY